MTDEEVYDSMRVVMKDSIQEHEDFYVIFTNSGAYYRTRESSKAFIGFGPIIVEKETKNFYQTPSYQPPSYFVEDFIRYKQNGVSEKEWTGFEV